MQVLCVRIVILFSWMSGVTLGRWDGLNCTGRTVQNFILTGNIRVFSCNPKLAMCYFVLLKFDYNLNIIITYINFNSMYLRQIKNLP